MVQVTNLNQHAVYFLLSKLYGSSYKLEPAMDRYRNLYFQV